MMERNLFLAMALLSFAALYAGVDASGGGSSSVMANVIVTCPFHLSLGAQPIYVWGSPIDLTYTAYAQTQCSAAAVPGNLVLSYAGNGIAAYSAPLTLGQLTPTPVEYDIQPIDSSGLIPGNYIAKVSFSMQGASNASSSQIAILTGPDISLADFSASGPVGVGSPITFTAQLSNSGQLASNAITLAISVGGARQYGVSESVPGLAPGQTEQLTFTQYAMTGRRARTRRT